MGAWKQLSTKKAAAYRIAKVSKPARKRVAKSAKIVTNRSVKHVLSPLVSTAHEFHTRLHEIVSVRKQVLQARRGSYRAALNPRTRLQTPFGGSGDQHVDVWSRRMLRELSRDMDRNADTFGVLNDAFASAVVGEGAKYRPTTKDAAWNKLVAEKLDQLFRRKKNGIDCRERSTGYRIQYDLVRAFAVDGECAFLKLATRQIQCFETEQITNGGHIQDGSTDGVNTYEDGRLESFHIVPYDLQGRLEYGEGDDYAADHVEWLANVNRFSQTRGVPLIVGGIDDWERLDSFRESEIIAAEQGSQIYGVIEHVEGDLGTARPFAASAVDPSQTLRGGVQDGSGNGGLAVDWQPTVAGAVLDLPDGKKYVPVDPQRPNPNAVSFMMELIRQFCAKAGLPYEYVYNDVRGLSWSINRALVQMARDRIGIWQTQFFAPMFSHLFHFILEGWIESGEIPANAEWEQHELQFSQISWPDEGQEYDAQTTGLLKGLTTRHRVHGPLWRDILEERAEELRFASELAKKHNSEFKEFPITPQFFLGFEGETTKSKTETDSTTETTQVDGSGKPIKKEKVGAA